MTNNSVCTAFRAHCVILLHMTKAAFQTFWHSLPMLALHHASTQATEACAFIAVLFMEILGAKVTCVLLNQSAQILDTKSPG